MSEEYKAAQAKLMLEQAADVDVIIVSLVFLFLHFLKRKFPERTGTCGLQFFRVVHHCYTKHFELFADIYIYIRSTDYRSYPWKEGSYLGQ